MASSSTNTSSAILGVSLSTIIAATLLVCVRIFVRTRMTRSFWWDDWFAVFATLISIAGTAFIILGVKAGAGQHVYNLHDPKSQVPDVVKWNTAYQLDNVISVNVIKVSILLFVLRIQNSKRTAWVIWFVIMAMSIINIATVLILALQCQPLRKLWRPEIPGVCKLVGSRSNIGYAQGVVNVLTDLFCTLTPVIILWNVRINLRLKVAICGLMSLGLIATASQIVRVVSLNTLNENDYPFHITTIMISAILDQNLGIIAACIPTLQPLFLQFGQAVRSWTAKSVGTRDRSDAAFERRSAKLPIQSKQGIVARHQRIPLAAAERTNTSRRSDESIYPLQPIQPSLREREDDPDQV